MTNDVDHGTTVFQVAVPLTPLYRRELASAVSRSHQGALEFLHRDDSIDQHLDVGTTADVAAAVFALISLIIQLRARQESQEWTLEGVDAAVREEAAKLFGTATVSPMRYAGLREFLDGTRSECVVSTEIEDEDVVFVVSRYGSVIAIRLD